MNQLHFLRDGKKTGCGQIIYRDTRLTNRWALVKIADDEPEKRRKLCGTCLKEARRLTEDKS